jgi:hypothetical protein
MSLQHSVGIDVDTSAADSGPQMEIELAELFSENAAAKIWRVGRSHLEQEVGHIPLEQGGRRSMSLALGTLLTVW